MISVYDQIWTEMTAKQTAKAYSVRDFHDLGSPTAVRKALSRLVRAGKIRRIRQGLYDVPSSHPIIGKTSPDIEGVVRGIMSSSSANWQFSGAYAANLLGLSEQVPAKIVILTDGVPRKVELGKLLLSFQRVAPRNLLGAGKPVGLVFQALRYIGNQSEDWPKHIKHLQRILDNETKTDLVNLIPKLPVWMQTIAKAIVEN